jgi:Phytanoyl-CoA dioxygenase (PhyH)
MHRQRTRLSARVNRIAGSVERRGVAATYELHDRLLGNRRSRRLYASAAEPTDDLQRDLVARLDVDGYATIPFAELFDNELWGDVERQGSTFIDDTEGGLALEAGSGSESGLKRRAGKEFVVRANSFEGVVLGLDDAWFRACTSPRLIGIANAYLRMWAKLSYVDLWYTAPQAVGSERVASQQWHQDFDDQHLLKAFLYFVDVGADAGPFEYVPGSQAGGRYVETWPWSPMGTRRVPEDEVNGRVSREAIKTFTAPQGTLILCNTSGLHRGGFATGNPRALATATYCSPASLAALSERNYVLEPGAAERLEPAARFAVT